MGAYIIFILCKFHDCKYLKVNITYIGNIVAGNSYRSQCYLVYDGMLQCYVLSATVTNE